MDKLSQFKELLKLTTESLTREEFTTSFKAVLDFVKRLKEMTAQELQTIKIMMSSAMEKMKSDHNPNSDKDCRGIRNKY